MGRPNRRGGGRRPWPPHIHVRAVARPPPPTEPFRGEALPTPLQERRFMWGFPSLSDLETEDGGEPWPTPSQASSFAARPSETEDHPSEVTSNLLGGALTDLAAIETLSLMNELPLLSPDETSEDSDDDYGIRTRQFMSLSTLSESDSNDDNDHAQHEPIELGIGSFGPQTLRYSEPRPRVKFGEGIPRRGQLTFEEINASTRARLDRLRLMGLSVSDSDDSSFSRKSTEDSDDDFKQGTELAGNSGTESPQPLQSSSAAAQHSTPKEPRSEASNAQLAENAENWMCEELKIVFEKYIERRDDLKGLDWCFNELCHQCFNVEHYHKIFHHYNFTVRMKKPDSVDWVVALYFAEVKQIFGRKYSFCCRLEPYENGHCYACKSQDVEDLQHPATGGYDNGSPHVGFGLWYE